MNIKVDLAAFRALTQEQLKKVAEAQSGYEPEDDVVYGRDAYIMWHHGHYALSVEISAIAAYAAYGLDEVRWATIGKLAEYNV